MKFILAFILVPLAMGIVFGLVRKIVETLIALIALAGIFFAWYLIDQTHMSLVQSLLPSLAIGGIAGILCIPLLPFYESKKESKIKTKESTNNTRKEAES